MSIFDGILPGSDPNTPNGFILTPQQAAAQQQMARQLMEEGSSTAPIQSGWQGAANLAKALLGGYESGQAAHAQRQGVQSATVAENVNASALAAALGQGGASASAPGSPALATALGAPAPGPAAPAGAGQASPLAGVNSDARGMRNNNPGNLESNSWTQGLPGYTGTDGRFAIFDNSQHGLAAMDANLSGYGRQGIDTPLSIASKWAPGSEQGNNPNSYGGAIARSLGVGLTDPVNMSDPATRAKIESAMALVENGPARSGASPAVAAISAATGGAAPGQSSPAQAAGAIPAPGGPQGAGAAAPASAPSQAPQAGGFHPNVQALMSVINNPWATPAQQQVAQSLLQSVLPGVPTVEKIKDASGAEHVVFVNPRTQTITTPPGQSSSILDPSSAGGALTTSPQPGAPPPVAGAMPGAPAAVAPGAPAPSPAAGAAVPPVASAVNMGAANGMTPQGATYLNGLEAQGGSGAVVARQARAIINGQAPLPEANAATRPVDVAIRDAVFRAAPEFSSSVAKARSDMVTQFGDKTSPTSAGGMIVAANTALHHLSALADSAGALHNGGSPLWNSIGNTAQEWTTGSPALKEYNLNKEALAGELSKIYKGGTPAEAETRAMVEGLSPNMTPAEQAAVFSKLSTLLQGKTNELQRQWQGAFGPNSTYPIIGDEGRGVIKRFSGGGASASPAAPASNAPIKLDAGNPDAHYNSLPSGARFVGPDGKTRVKP